MRNEFLFFLVLCQNWIKFGNLTPRAAISPTTCKVRHMYSWFFCQLEGSSLRKRVETRKRSKNFIVFCVTKSLFEENVSISFTVTFIGLLFGWSVEIYHHFCLHFNRNLSIEKNKSNRLPKMIAHSLKSQEPIIILILQLD